MISLECELKVADRWFVIGGFYFKEEVIMARNQTKTQSEISIAESAAKSTRQIWLAGLGAFVKAQEEGNKAFVALVKEGERIQKKNRKVAEESIALVSTKVSDGWGRLEQGFEDRVARTLSSLGVPSKKDIDKLSKRIAELTVMIQKLVKAEEAAPKSAKVETLVRAA